MKLGDFSADGSFAMRLTVVDFHHVNRIRELDDGSGRSGEPHFSTVLHSDDR